MAPDDLSRSDSSPSPNPLPPEASSGPVAVAGTIPLPAATSGDIADSPGHPVPTGVLLVPLVLAFAFLLASFPARNTDLWMHLAAGRLLVEGGLSLASPPHLPFGPEVSPRWLYHLASYGVYSALGDQGLVLVKALVVAGLALVLLRLSWAGQGWWMPAGCTALALLAMSTRLLLQPATISYFFLALTLWFLRQRDEEPAGRVAAPWLPPWPLLILFVAWVNVDSWFVLGLATVALVWLGQTLDEGRAAGSWLGPLIRRTVSLACLSAVCLLNPAGLRGFSLPPELGWFGASGQPLGRVFSPFQEAYLQTLGQTPAGLAYFPLLLFSLASFFQNLRQRWPWARFLPWLGLALLSALQVRAVPFFAVVAGPMLARNLQDWLAWQADPQRASLPGRKRPSYTVGGRAAGRALALILGLLLLACAWPGWLQAPPYEPRRWGVATPASLEAAAGATRRWHQEGKLGLDSRGLHLSPETAHAFAWFCPEEKGLLDAGLSSAIRGESAAPDDWADRLRAQRVNHLILHDPNRSRLEETLARLLPDPAQWPLLYMEGDVAVFGWRDPAGAKGADAFGSWQLDMNRLAFRPAESKKAPPGPPGREPQARPWWEAFWEPAPTPPIDRDEATMHLLHAEALRRSAAVRHLIAWGATQSAGLVSACGGGLGGPSALVDAEVRLVLLRPQVPKPGEGVDVLPVLDRMSLALQQRFVYHRDDTSPGLLFLAIRAARRAIAENPRDARAYHVLGESYLLLLESTSERAWGRRFPELVRLRRAQASAALNRAVALNPGLGEAHRSLAGMYQEMGYLDLALAHLRAHDALSRQASAVGEQGRPAAEQLERLAKAVSDRETAHAKATAGARVFERASQAMEKGLAGRSRDLLLQSDVSAFGAQGMALELELLLRTGRTKDVLDWTAPEQRSSLGVPTYHWLRTQALAASGEYALADQECLQLARSMTPPEEARKSLPPRAVMGLVISRAILHEQPGMASWALLPRRIFTSMQFQQSLASLVGVLRHDADTNVLRGLLALEHGEVDRAREAFREALALWRDPEAAASGAGLDFSGRVIAQGYLHWLEAQP